MDFLNKIEDFINTLLVRFWKLLVSHVVRATPTKVKTLLSKIDERKTHLKEDLKALPGWLKAWALKLIAKGKGELGETDFKAKFTAALGAVKTQMASQHSKGQGKLKSLLGAPVLFIAQWLKGLSTGQSVLLMGSSAASIIASISIFSSGSQLAREHFNLGRAPASVEVEVSYDRPNYYKNEKKHVSITNIRLPVYFAQVNELRSVDIDFNLTLSNREARMKLEKLEFQLRDYLVLNIEPIVASFPLEEEGREILKKKIWLEVNNFLKEREILGEVKELQITYVLAN
jgi:flagellar basal body-associated protein FliL